MKLALAPIAWRIRYVTHTFGERVGHALPGRMMLTNYAHRDQVFATVVADADGLVGCTLCALEGGVRHLCPFTLAVACA